MLIQALIIGAQHGSVGTLEVVGLGHRRRTVEIDGLAEVEILVVGSEP